MKKCYIDTNVNYNSQKHPAGTSKDSDKCDLSKDSEIAPFNIGVYGQ